LPGGGESINFIIDGVVNSYLVPPNNFNPKKATNEQLAEYGLPTRPSDPALLKDWEKEMKNFKHAVKPLKAYVKKNTSNTTYSTYNWAGTIDYTGTKPDSSDANSSTGLFQCVTGCWTQPTVSCNSAAYAEATWVGIGGLNNTGALLQCGTACGNAYNGYEAWYEYLNNSGGGISTTAFTVNAVPIKVAANDSIQAIVSGGGVNAAFAITVNGSYTSVTASNVSDYYYGGTAEWIVERPYCYGSTSNLATFTKVTFSGCAAFTNRTNVGSTVGVTYPMNTFPETQVSMYAFDNSTVLAHPDPSSYTASGFTVYQN